MHLRRCLRKAVKLQPKPRNSQVAGLRNAEPVMELPYTLIEQMRAAKSLQQCLISRWLEPEQQGLVVVLTGTLPSTWSKYRSLTDTGPSGHGKTELASNLGLY